MHRLLLPLVLLVLVVAHAAHAEVKPLKGWRQMQSANFYLIGDVGEGDLRRVAGRLEQFRAAVGMILPKATITSATPTTVLVFRSNRNFEPFKPLYNGKIREDIAGYFVGGPAVNYIALTTESNSTDEDERFGIIFHELVHLMVNNTVRGVPVWLNEGLAEYYRTLQVASSGQQVIVGRVHPPHVLLLRERFLPVDELVAVDHKSPLYNEGAKATVFYAESWALVHYLLLGEKQKYAAKAGPLLDALASGLPFAEACPRALGISVAQLQKELKAYVSRESFTMIQWTFAERLAAVERLPSSPFSDAEAHATAGALLLQMDRRDEARQHLELALALEPVNAQAHSALGLLYVRASRVDLAREHLQQAAAGGGATAQTHYLLATTLQRIVEDRGDAGADAEQRIEAALRQAIALDPAFAEGFAALASALSRRPGASKEVFELQQKAIRLAPGREDFMLNFAYYLVNAQEHADAKVVLSGLASGASKPEIRDNAKRLLKRILDFEHQLKAGEAVVEHTAEGPRVFKLELREVKGGESQLKGMLRAIECQQGQIRMVVEHDGKTSQVQAASFDTVDFITYRESQGGRIDCGKRPDGDRVLVTYRPGLQGASLGELVAVEFLPLTQEPK